MWVCLVLNTHAHRIDALKCPTEGYRGRKIYATNADVTCFICLGGGKGKKKKRGVKQKAEKERINICRSFQRFIRNTNRGVATYS